MRILLAVVNLLTGVLLIRFTVSKFAAWPVAVSGFEEMSKPIGVDPTMFRIVTGFIIGYAMLSFFLNALLVLLKKLDGAKALGLFVFGHLFSIGAMGGALLSEFFLRSSPKWMLVYIAVGIIAIAVVNLLWYRNNIARTLLQR